MPYTVKCSSCKKSYAFKPELAGKRVKCKCGGRIQFPDVEPEPEPELLSDDAVIEDEGEYDLRSPPSRSVPTDDDSTLPCRNCGVRLPAGTILCTACGYNHRTGAVAQTQVAPPPRRAKPAARSTKSSSSSASANYEALSGFDIFLIVCCSGIALILGLVRGIQGKGWDMFFGALIMNCIWGGIRLVAELIAAR
jgi:hypothetical protein